MALYKAGEFREIPVKDLKPDSENYRFEPASSVEDSIDVMVDSQKTSLYNLAEDIMKTGLSSGDLVMVVPEDDSDKFVVIDGNRRLIALMSVLTPSLIPASMPTLRRKFEKLSKDHKELKNDEKLRCVIFPDKATARHWIEKEHSGKDDGRGKDEWDALQKDRFLAASGKYPQAFSVWENVAKDADDDLQQCMKTPKYYSTFQRIVKSKPGKELIGISEVSDDGVVKYEDEPVARNILKAIIQDLATKERDVNAVRKANDIKSYVTSVREDVTGKKMPKQKKREGKSSSRAYVIPKKCSLSISERKVQMIVEELQSLKVVDYRISASILLRSLLELSMEKYVMVTPQFASTLGNDEKKKQLYYRLVKFFEYAKGTLKIDKNTMVPWRKATIESRALPLTEELNAYVHNLKMIPKPDDLITTWDNIEGLLVKIWSETAATENKD